jgi:glutathione peroxidase-family protein
VINNEVGSVMIMEYTSVFDIPVKSQFDEPNLLDNYRGKVLVFVNTTGHCGNIPQ